MSGFAPTPKEIPIYVINRGLNTVLKLTGIEYQKDRPIIYCCESESYYEWGKDVERTFKKAKSRLAKELMTEIRSLQKQLDKLNVLEEKDLK